MIKMPIVKEAVCLFRDGDKICAVMGDFIDLQSSPAGFGDDFEEAINALNLERKKTMAFRDPTKQEEEAMGHWAEMNATVKELQKENARLVRIIQAMHIVREMDGSLWLDITALEREQNGASV